MKSQYEDEEEEKVNNMDYMTYVKYMLDKYRSYTELIHDNDITPSSVNSALANYSKVQLCLIAELKRKNAMLHYATQEYNNWYSNKYSETRKKLTSEIESKSVKLGQKEIEYEMRVLFSEEMQKLEDKVFFAEEGVSYLTKILTAWDNFSKMLTSLSNNMRTEMITLNIGDRMVKDTNIKKIRQLDREEVIDE
jgi:hypothetical protein